MRHDTNSDGAAQGRGLFDFLSEPTGDDADRLRHAFMVALLAGPTSCDVVREREGLPGDNRCGMVISGLRKRGWIVSESTTQAQARSARGRLTRLWHLTERGRREAERLAGLPAEAPAA